MKIRILKVSFLLLTMIVVFASCGGDDDDDIAPFVEEDRTEQQAKDNDSLLLYLSTHYYNSSFFESGTNHKYTDIIITEIEEGEEVPDGHTLLINAVGTPETTTYLDTDYEYYVLRLNQGGGEAPNFTDQVRVRYEGSSIVDGDVFDGVITPVDLLLQGNGINTFGTIKAWQLIMPTFNTAIVPSEGYSIINGVVQYENFGLGVMFVPSGLGYFSGFSTGSSYDNLIFKFELLQYVEIDHDNDGIPSYLEDLDGDIEVSNDDTDDDVFPNFIDTDDDDDDTLTIDEIIVKIYTEDDTMTPFMSEMEAQDYFDNNAVSNEILIGIDYNSSDSTYTINTIIIPDTNNDGVPDYLDENITINYNEDESN